MVTPGDWTHSNLEVQHRDDVKILADGELIAKVVGIGSNSERNANVRAIVNAPKMLEMLKHVLGRDVDWDAVRDLVMDVEGVRSENE